MSVDYPNTKFEIHVEYTKTGIPKYVAELRHTALDKHRIIRDSNEGILRRKADAQLLQWHKQWKKERHLLLSEDQAEQYTLAAVAVLKSVEDFLVSRADQATRLTRRSKEFSFLEPKPTEPKQKATPRKPSAKKYPKEPIYRPSEKPNSTDSKYIVKYTIADWFSRSAREDKKELAFAKHRGDLKTWEERETLKRSSAKANWQTECVAVDIENQTLLSEWTQRCSEVKALNEKKHQTHLRKIEKWESEKSLHEETTTRLFEDYKSGSSDAVKTIIMAALNRVSYPDWFENEYEIFFDHETGVAGIDFRLPEPTDLPTLMELVFVKSRDTFSEKHLPAKDRESLYDSLIYQVALLILQVCFRSTQKSVLKSVVFNGFVKTRAASTGRQIRPYILSVHAERTEFEGIELQEVDPKQCVRGLKGVGSPKLYALAPIAPILTFDKEDSRFIEGRNVSGNINEGTNIAAMPWDDFEHLMRELFEKMFADRGMEVKVTQQSRDRGVDAIAFDPDPITGGKYVLQAKCYTNVVPAAAVRELEGTVSGERASLGILITTSSFGPEAIKWASDKPLRLIDGSNLLHLLEQHGHKAYIDLNEAKEIRNEEIEKRTRAK